MRNTARVVAWSLLVLLLAACNPQQNRQFPSSASSGPTPMATLTPLSLTIIGKGTADRPVRFVEQKRNRRLYQLLARSYESAGSQGNARATFDDVSVEFFDRNGSTLDASAPRAIVDETANTVTLLGGVHGRASTGMLLQCDTLVYAKTTEMIHGEGHIVASDSRGMRVTGNRFDSNISLTHTRMQ